MRHSATLCFFSKVCSNEISNNKHQNPNKSEAPVSKFQTFPISDLNFGIWHLFVICHLDIGTCGASRAVCNPWQKVFFSSS
jgi:hypothetical protein